MHLLSLASNDRHNTDYQDFRPRQPHIFQNEYVCAWHRYSLITVIGRV